MDGLVLDDGAEVENRFQRGQALYLNYYSKKYVRHKVFGCWLDDVWSKKNGAIFTLPGAVELASYGSMVITCGQTEVNHGWFRVQQPTCTWDTDLSTCTVQSAAAVPTSIIKSSSREQGATLAIEKTRWIQLSCYSMLCSCWSNEPRKKKLLLSIMVVVFLNNNPHIYPKQPRFLFIARICSNRDPTKLLVSQNPPRTPVPLLTSQSMNLGQ